MARYPVLAASLCAALTVFSASDVSGQLTLSIGGGVVASTFGGADAEDLFGTTASKGSRIGMTAGAALAIPVASRFAIVPGAHFVQKGAQYQESGVDATFKGTYVVVPVLASVTLTGADSPAGFDIFAGPAVGFETGCDIEVSDATTSASQSCDDLGLDERQKLDFGIAAGAGLSFPLTDRVSIMLSGGVDLGLRTLDTSDTPDDIKNRAFFGRLAAAFPLGG